MPDGLNHASRPNGHDRVAIHAGSCLINAPFDPRIRSRPARAWINPVMS